MPALLTINKKAFTQHSLIKKSMISTAIPTILAGALLTVSTAHAAPEIAITSSAGSSTTVVEQYSDGKTATITATPHGITMQDGMPYAVTQVTNVPRYTVRQVASNGASNTVVTQSSTTVTSVPVTNQMTDQTSNVDVIAVPTTSVTQVLPVTTATQLINLTVINNQ